MKKIIISLCTLVFFTACTSTKKSESWEVNEIFTQLSELRKEVKTLKNEVQSLKQGVLTTTNKKKNEKKPISIDLSNNFSLGSAKAVYGIVEFTDYQCPYCSKHNKKTLPQIKQQYIDSGRLKYIMKDFPLDFHGQAKLAAISARCSGRQGKFWQMHDLIFASSQRLSESVFSSFANQLELDVLLFSKCTRNPDVVKEVENDIVEGELIGVRGTPAFFIGRIKDNKLTDVKALFGAQSFASFSRVINSLVPE